MPLNTPTDLILYELGAMYNAERSGGQLLEWLSSQVRTEELAGTLRQKQENAEQLRNLESCFRSLGGSPLDVPSATVQAMRGRVEDFVSLQPSPEVLELHTVSAAMRLAHFGIASYRSLVDRAMLMEKSDCAQSLQANLVQKEEFAGRLERVGHEITQKMFVPA